MLRRLGRRRRSCVMSSRPASRAGCPAPPGCAAAVSWLLSARARAGRVSVRSPHRRRAPQRSAAAVQARPAAVSSERIGAGVLGWHLVPGCRALGDSQLVADQLFLVSLGIGHSHAGRLFLPYAPTLAAALSKQPSPPFSLIRRPCSVSLAPPLVEPRVFLYPHRHSSRHPPISVSCGLSRAPMSP